ncbi:N-acetylglucosamine kinase [Lacipirellula sp.]|uniref:N-acetylglucosamine kinase n=1 Tax=Lacipirellula sp. TaxID=2691419 RepID=UPI003D0C4543
MPTNQATATDAQLAIGVDGGGTKTEVWLAQLNGSAPPAILGRGLAASSNPRAVGMETALANLGAAINLAWADAKLTKCSVRVAVLAMSGAGHAAVREEIGAWARAQGIAEEIRFEHDAEPVLAEGTPAGQGIALIVGTGSAAIGADVYGKKHVVGGWGYHYGDEGSAYWIGREALVEVARSADGRSAPTMLVSLLMAKLEVDEPRSILGALEKTGNVRGAIARLAVVVEQAAREGDVAALRIVREGARELALMTATLATRLELGPKFPLALAGGVICGSDLLYNELLAALAQRDIHPEPVKRVPNPVAGCLRLAQRYL